VPETEIPWHRNGTRVRLWIRLHCARSRADDRVPMTAVGWHATSLEVDGGRDEADSTWCGEASREPRGGRPAGPRPAATRTALVRCRASARRSGRL